MNASHRVLALALLLTFWWCAISTGFAQQNSGVPRDDEDETLSTRENDPTASLTQIQVKDIYTPAEYGTNAKLNVIQVRSVLAVSPLTLLPVEQLIRPTIKIVTEPRGKGSATATGYDDMQLFDLLVLPWPDAKETLFRWAIGPYLVLPTSSIKYAGQGAWQIGPAFGFSYRGVPRLNLSGLMQQATSFAYTSSRSKPTTSLTFQPLLSYDLNDDWYLKSSDATWTFNLRHRTSTTIPFSAGGGKVWKISKGYAIDTSLSGEWMLYRQFATQTEQFSLVFQIALLLPKG